MSRYFKSSLIIAGVILLLLSGYLWYLSLNVDCNSPTRNIFVLDCVHGSGYTLNVVIPLFVISVLSIIFGFMRVYLYGKAAKELDNLGRTRFPNYNQVKNKVQLVLLVVVVIVGLLIILSVISKA